MKRIYLALILSFVTILPTLAQHTHRQSSSHSSGRYESRRNYYGQEIYYGLRLGLAVASINSDDIHLDGGSGMAGLNIGGVAGIQLGNAAPFYLEGGLHYIQKGGKGYVDRKKFTYDLNYLEIPIVLKYKHELENDMALQPFIGGYLACGIAGKIKNFGDRESYSSFSDSAFQRFDGGLRLGCGFSYMSLYLDLAYDFGLTNICHDTFDSSHTGCFYATLGVDF